MQGSEFRGLAEAVTRAYGDDPWYFLRELAQNSRDAGARAIHVEASAAPEGSESITFADDGRGMTMAHARRFLFRLYASDKGGDPAAAGCYGIGFWTVLRFAPALIGIQSRHGREAWAVTLDGSLAARPAECRLERPGTTITLTRPARGPAEEEFVRQVKEGLRAYCRYLRRNDRRGSPLPLWFAGSDLTEPMTLPGPLSLSFRSGPVEGAVGLATRPEVRLFARGLPVWRGALLGQMSYLNMDADDRADVGGGLAPVFLLNGNHLDVTFSRDLAVENRALNQVRRKGEAALRRLLETSLERTFPRRWPRRAADGLRTAWRRLRRPGWHWLPLVALALLPLEILLLRHWRPAAGTAAPAWFSLRAAPLSYRGAAVGGPAAQATPPLAYAPGVATLFRLFTADVYDKNSGFVRGARRDRLPPTWASPCRVAAMSLRLRAAAGETFLPLPPGRALVRGTLRLAGRPLPGVFATIQGETIARLPSGGLVEYLACPSPASSELSPAEEAHFTALPPGLTLPSDLESAAAAARPAAIAARAELASALARSKLAYDISPAVGERFRRERGEGSWLGRVLLIGAGDCDVINGLQVLLLRRMGVPARLVIGLVGEAGFARSRLHAWSEYFDRGWKVSDATPVTRGGTPWPGGDARPPARRARFSRGTGPAQALNPLAPLPILLSLLAGAAVIFLLSRRERATTAAATAGEIHGPLLQIARQAMLQPELWGVDSPLRRHPLLPTVDGRRISFRQAERLLRRRRLFFTANRNPLALAMAAGRATVLDLGQAPYAPLRSVLEGAIDADMLCRLRPQPPQAGDGLLAAVNDFLARRRRPPRGKAFAGSAAGVPRGGIPCLTAPGTPEPGLVAVELPAPLKHAPFYFPRRFIAVAPAGKAYSRALALFRTNPALATLRFLRRLGEEGVVAQGSLPSLLRKAARRLLKDAHG